MGTAEGAKELFFKGLGSLEHREFGNAERYLLEALKLAPRSIPALVNLAIAQYEQSKISEAAITAQKVIDIDPANLDALSMLSTCQNAQGHYEEAAISCRTMIGIDPSLAEAHCNLGHALKQTRQYEKAIESFDRAIGINPRLANAWLGRGHVCIDLKRFDEAVNAYDKALAAAPGLEKAWLGRGNACVCLRRFDEAFAAYDRVLSLKHESEDAWLGRGHVFIGLKRYDEALAAYDKALSIKPGLAEACLGRGDVFAQLKNYDEALTAYDKALSLKPDLESAWVGRGYVLFSLNRDHEALACFEKALALKQDLAEAQLNIALLKLSLGDFEDGWRLYEWRWRTEDFTSPARRFTQPLWLNDSDIAHKTVLIHAEQGLGDTIQFSRYLDVLKDKKCRIIFEVPKPLSPLFRSPEWPCDVIEQGQTIAPFDAHCPLVSLPLAFKTNLETIPAHVPYIRATDGKKAEWAAKIGAVPGKPRIGLAWSGNPRFAGGNDVARPVPLAVLAAIMSDNFEWYRLQTDLRASDKPALARLPAMRDFSGLFHDFSDTAGLIEQLDLVISIDTAIAHLAGAMGKPVWILLPFHPDFRWLRERTDSPWYPTARLYRQSRIFDWADVMERVSSDMTRLVRRETTVETSR